MKEFALTQNFALRFLVFPRLVSFPQKAEVCSEVPILNRLFRITMTVHMAATRGTLEPAAREFRKGEFTVSTDPALIELDEVHEFLTESYWAKGISREVVARSIENSLCFGLYAQGKQIGFARVISDYATYAYIGDVFVLESFRGRGLGKWLMECIMHHPRLQGLRRWSLITRDAHGLYAQLGFTSLDKPRNYMELHHPDVYQKAGQ
jgi:GNAT superfamily N-acetyltransferase